MSAHTASISKQSAPTEEPLCSLISPVPLHRQFDPTMILNHNGQQDRMVQLTRDATLTAASADFGQLAALHRSIDMTTTKLGSAALLRDILHPPNTIAGVEERRAAIQELRTNSSLREFLESKLRESQKPFLRGVSTEECALRVLAPELADDSKRCLGRLGAAGDYALRFLNANRDMPVRLKSLGALLKPMKDCPEPSSPILKRCLGSIREALSSPDSELLNGKIMVRPDRLETREKTPWYVPSYRLTGSFFNPEEFSGSLGFLCASLLSSAVTATFGESSTLGRAILPVAAGIYLVSVARNFLITGKTQLQLQERAQKAAHLAEAVDAIGEMDALLSLAKFGESLSYNGCLPALLDKTEFSASYVGMKNPTLAMQRECVANDLSVGSGKVFILTGPNSGGKSTIATSLLQNQVLAQLGAPVLAAHAELTVADQILYQGPTFKALGEHGKFGTELAATRDLFQRATSRSLVLLDEVGDGTSAKESRRQTAAALKGFIKLGIGTVLVTHNSRLAESVVARGFGDAWQLEIIQDSPTYRLIPGVSHHSNADRVAKILGFSPEDIREQVRERLRSRRGAQDT